MVVLRQGCVRLTGSSNVLSELEGTASCIQSRLRPRYRWPVLAQFVRVSTFNLQRIFCFYTSYNSTTLPDIVLITSVLPQFTIIEFEHDTLRILLDYLHTGSCPLTCSTIPGLICAAEHYDLPELLQACFHHAKQFLRIEVVSLC